MVRRPGAQGHFAASDRSAQSAFHILDDLVSSDLRVSGCSRRQLSPVARPANVKSDGAGGTIRHGRTFLRRHPSKIVHLDDPRRQRGVSLCQHRQRTVHLESLTEIVTGKLGRGLEKNLLLAPSPLPAEPWISDFPLVFNDLAQKVRLPCRG